MGQKRRDLTPERSLLHLWGSELRAWRDRRGMSLARLASEIFYDASHLGKFERAERTPPLHVVQACEKVLDTGGELVRLRMLMERPDTAAASARPCGHEAKPPVHEADPASGLFNEHPEEAEFVGKVVDNDSGITSDTVMVPTVGTDGKVVLMAVPRRVFLAGLGAAAVEAAMPAPTASALPLAGDLLDHFRSVQRVLMDTDNLFGPLRVITSAEEQIGLMHRFRQDVRGDRARALLQLMTQYADLCAWLYQDCGNYRVSDLWSCRALEWSHLAGNQDSTSFILARRSQLAADMRRPGEAVDTADAALRIAPHGSRIAAIAATYKAHGHALDGDRAGCDRLYDQSREIHREADDDPDCPWGLFLDTTYIDVQQAHSFHSLADFTAAADLYEATLEKLPTGYHRDRGVYLGRAALAHAGAGHLERASHLGKHALAILAGTGSGRISAELAQLDSMLAPSGNVRAVAEFTDAFHAHHSRQARTP